MTAARAMGAVHPEATGRMVTQSLWGNLRPAACLLILGLITQSGCLSDKIDDDSAVAVYQRSLADQGPQRRLDAEDATADEPLDLLRPADVPDRTFREVNIVRDPNTGKRTARLTLEEVMVRALANSPEIRIVSFDPEIARHGITDAVGEFDPTAFGRVNYENQDSPLNSVFEPGRADTRLLESGVRQRTILGSEWSASYSLSRIWDDLFGRTLPTRYEPMFIFELRQPLLRGAGETVNLAALNVARLNYEASLLSFRQRAEEVLTAVTTSYWQLVQAQRAVETQRWLVAQTAETLNKVVGRREIDATDVQIKQAEAFARVREATLLTLEKRVKDTQDALARLMADPQINTTSNLQVIPATELLAPEDLPEATTVEERALATAMNQNPSLQRARLGVRVAEINLEVAKNQKMPRLDLVGSARTQGLARERRDAHAEIESGDYTSYSVGLTFEYPLGNRQRHAEWLRRQLERRQATSVLHSTADEVAVQVKESARRVRNSLEEAELQTAAAEAARIQLFALTEAEAVRERLTPEFLLVKLQAQETFAQARQARIEALVQSHVALAELAEAMGTGLELRLLEPPSAPPMADPVAADEAMVGPVR